MNPQDNRDDAVLKRLITNTVLADKGNALNILDPLTKSKLVHLIKHQAITAQEDPETNKIDKIRRTMGQAGSFGSHFGLIGIPAGMALGGAYEGGKQLLFGDRQNQEETSLDLKNLDKNVGRVYDEVQHDPTFQAQNALTAGNSAAALAGLINHPLNLATHYGLTKNIGSIPELEDKHLDELLEHSDLAPSRSQEQVRVLAPTKDQETWYNENAAFGTDKSITPSEQTENERYAKAFPKSKFVPNTAPTVGRIETTSKRMWRPGVVAHELGHASIHKNKGVMGFIQDKLSRPTSHSLYGILPAAATAYATKDDDNIATGAGKGALIGTIGHAPRLLTEFEASRRGINAINKTSLPDHLKGRNIRSLALPLASYLLGTTGANAGVGALNAYSNKIRKKTLQKRSDDRSNNNPLAEIAEGAGAVQGLGWGTKALLEAPKYRPSKLIAVTGGNLKKPSLMADVTAGHVTLADAMHEALEKHPAVQKGEFTVDKAYRLSEPEKVKEFQKSYSDKTLYDKIKNYLAGFDLSYQKPFALQNQKNHGMNHAAVTLDTGFGSGFATTPIMGGRLRDAEFTSNPEGHVGVIPDPLHSQPSTFDKLFLNANNPLGKMRYVGFGKDKGYDPNAFDRVGHYEEHPAVKDQVLNLAEERLKNPITRHKAYLELSDALRQSEDHESANLIDDAILKNKKIITISGSSRGDLVAARARELYHALHKRGIADKHQIVALMADAKNNPLDMTERLIDGLPIARVGNTNQYFPGQGQSKIFDLINESDYHWGSTGASASAEAKMSKVPTGFVSNFAKLRDQQIDLLKQKYNITPEIENQLRSIDLDQWNKGTIAGIRDHTHGKNKGLDLVNTGDDLVSHLEKMEQGQLKKVHTDRAQSILEKSRQSKADLADRVIRLARKVNANAHNSNAKFNLVGGGLALGGGLLGADLIRRKYQDSQMNKHHKRKVKHAFDTGVLKKASELTGIPVEKLAFDFNLLSQAGNDSGDSASGQLSPDDQAIANYYKTYKPDLSFGDPERAINNWRSGLNNSTAGWLANQAYDYGNNTLGLAQLGEDGYKALQGGYNAINAAGKYVPQLGKGLSTAYEAAAPYASKAMSSLSESPIAKSLAPLAKLTPYASAALSKVPIIGNILNVGGTVGEQAMGYDTEGAYEKNLNSNVLPTINTNGSYNPLKWQAPNLDTSKRDPKNNWGYLGNVAEAFGPEMGDTLQYLHKNPEYADFDMTHIPQELHQGTNWRHNSQRMYAGMVNPLGSMTKMFDDNVPHLTQPLINAWYSKSNTSPGLNTAGLATQQTGPTPGTSIKATSSPFNSIQPPPKPATPLQTGSQSTTQPFATATGSGTDAYTKPNTMNKHMAPTAPLMNTPRKPLSMLPSQHTTKFGSVLKTAFNPGELIPLADDVVMGVGKMVQQSNTAPAPTEEDKDKEVKPKIARFLDDEATGEIDESPGFYRNGHKHRIRRSQIPDKHIHQKNYCPKCEGTTSCRCSHKTGDWTQVTNDVCGFCKEKEKAASFYDEHGVGPKPQEKTCPTCGSRMSTTVSNKKVCLSCKTIARRGTLNSSQHWEEKRSPRIQKELNAAMGL